MPRIVPTDGPISGPHAAAPLAGSALSISFVQRPQDNSADAVLDVELAPSYVFYSAAAVQRVSRFFTPPQAVRDLDFSGISVAAATQLERARRAAAE